MKQKIKIKMGIDFLMTGLLLCLMAYQITGQELHEWFGAGMLVLFFIHSMLNVKWYGRLFKGKYKVFRIIQTIVNFSVFVAILCLGYSGIVMSRYVFAAFPINGPMATSRSMHMAASYWGFVLMSFHLGMHWGQICGVFRRPLKNRKVSSVFKWILRLAVILTTGYGLFCFIRKDILSYMFPKIQFVFFDFEQSVLSVFLEYTAMMGFWIFVSFSITKGIGVFSSYTVQKKGNKNEEDSLFRQ